MVLPCRTNDVVIHLKLYTMKKLILAVLILAGAASVQAQQDTTMKRKTHQQGTMKGDSSSHRMKKNYNKSDSTGDRMNRKRRTDSTAAKQ